MRFALINMYYEYSSTGRIMKHYHDLIKSLGHEVRMYYGRRKENYPDEIVYINNSASDFLSNRLSYYFGLSGMTSFLPTMRLLSDLNRYKPDIVWLGNIHGNYVNEYILLSYLKRHSILTVYGLPDEYAFLGKCCNVTDCEKYTTEEGCHKCPHLHEYPHSRFFDNSHIKFELKRRAYKGFDKLVLRTAPYVLSNARKSWLLRDKEMIPSDSSVDISGTFYPRDAAEIKNELGIPDDTRVVLVCAPLGDPKKGVEYFLEAAKLCLNDNIIFINVWFIGEQSKMPSNYIGLPFETDKERMAKLYSLADAYICTSIADAQPNTCLEAMGCGTPIIGFNISGVPFVAPPEIGTFVEPRNIKQLADAIKQVKKKTPESIEYVHRYAVNRFSHEVANKRAIAFIEELCNRVNK